MTACGVFHAVMDTIPWKKSCAIEESKDGVSEIKIDECEIDE